MQDEGSASIDALAINQEGSVEHVHNENTFINSRVAKVLTLGAGGDDQSHVSRPRTAKTTQNSNFKRPDSKLETITERNPAEEEAIAVS